MTEKLELENYKEQNIVILGNIYSYVERFLFYPTC